MILYFKQLGLTTTECSIIYGCLPLFSGFFNFTVGAVADKLQLHRQITLLVSVLSAVLLNGLLLVPPVHQGQQLEGYHYVYYCSKQCNNSIVEYSIDLDSADGHRFLHGNTNSYKLVESEVLLENCSSSSAWNFSIENICSHITAHDGYISNNLTSLCDGGEEAHVCIVHCINSEGHAEQEKALYGRTFWMVFILYFTATILYNSLWITLYGMTFAVLGEKGSRFGQQRSWGAVGAVVASAVSALTMNKYRGGGGGGSRGTGNHHSDDITFIPCFIGFSLGVALTGVSAIFFKLPKIKHNATMTKDFLKLFRQLQVCSLFAVLFVMGFLHGGVEMFLFVFLRELNASAWVLGSCLLVRYLVEIPSYYYSGRIMERIGHTRCLYLVFSVLTLRSLGTSLIPSPWWELPLSLARSVAYSIGYAAVCVYGSLITPPSMHATLQGFIMLIFNGFGKQISSNGHCSWLFEKR